MRHSGVLAGNHAGCSKVQAALRDPDVACCVWGNWEAQPVFSRVAIVNRGEAAMRLIHAVRDLSAETGTRIETVALYTDADRTATFVREADIAYPLGPASARPYLDHAVLERALVQTGADAAWVGWGFVAEDPTFAELCDKLGVTFVGPSPEALEARRRGGRRPSRAVEPRRGRHPRRRAARR